MNYIKRSIYLACLFLMVACSKEQTTKDSQLALMKATNPNPVVTEKASSLDRVEEIKKDVSAFPEIYDVAIIKGKKKTLVVYKVKHLHRFKMKKIEKNLNQKLEERYPKEQFTVSSDYKIFLEAIRLKERMISHKFTDKKAEKRLNEIIKMSNDTK